MSDIEEIEICLEDALSMKPLKYFSNLKVLSLCNVNLQSIEGLQNCKLLAELYLSENNLQRIENLQGLSELRRLNISSNKIITIENLESLVSLEMLWLNENQIESIEGLLCNKHLKDLALAQNVIQFIGSGLDHLESLEKLNLSGNPICSFSEVLKLSKLPKLVDFSLSDPNHSESTICSLSNYSIFVLYYFTRLRSLDCNFITQESRNNAETTFLKKKLYYTMKIKTFKRSVANLTKIITQEAQQKQKSTWDYVLGLLKQIKALERDIDENCLESNSPINLFNYDVSKQKNHGPEKLDELHSLLINKVKEEYQKICGYNRIFHCLSSKITKWAKGIVQELEIETSGAGNIRYEIGTPNDSWYKSCCELVNSRYCEGMEVAVTRVVRIHNRLLRNRFEEKLESLIDTSENHYKRNIDYLFYGGQDLQEIVEQGFKTIKEYSDLGQPCCIPLSYSLETTEIERVRQMCQDFDDVHEIYWPKGQVLLCKVYFGKGKGDLRVPYYKENMTPAEIWELCPFNPPNVCWAVYRTFELDAKQRVWFIFDNSLVLPEYLIEFEYTSNEFSQNQIQFENGLESISRPVNAFYSEKILSEKVPQENLENYAIKRTLITEITESNVKFVIKGKNSEYLNLLDCNIREINWSENLKHLTTLILSCNNLTNVEFAKTLVNLNKLDVSFNLISSFDGLECLLSLTELDAHNNKLFSVAEVRKLPKCITKITCFHNEMYWDTNYDEVILSLLPNLIILDWRNISKNLRKSQNLEISQKLLESNGFGPIPTPDFVDFCGRLELLELKGVFLTSLSGLELFPSLKKLNLDHNLLSIIDFTNKSPDLEELSLSQNYLQGLSGLACLKNLKSLEISHNKLSNISEIARHEHLTHLALDNNFIKNIEIIKELKSLIELYLSNNFVEDAKDILICKQLPELVVLDIFGNPCMENPRTKSLVLYQINNLKVFNGLNIDYSEISQAKLEFEGVLNEELLEKRSFGLKTTELRQLDLSNSKLRTIECMFTYELFPKLLELNVSGNLFTSVSIFSYMPNLAKLDISNNKIESFQHGPKGFLSLPNIEILNISYNSIYNFLGLQQANLKNLRIFNVSHNNISRIDMIEYLQNLRELDISFNKIRNIDKKLELPHIRSLNFENNGLKNLNFLENLNWIQYLKASNNRITDVNDIEKIQSLPNLLELVLTPNPIERKVGYRNGIIRKIPNLMFLDGKEVTEEERIDGFEVKKPLINSGVGKLAAKIASITLDNYFFKIHPRTAGQNSRKN